MAMTYEEAIKILQPEIQEAHVVFRGLHQWVELMLGIGRFQLDGEFTFRELEAIVVWGNHQIAKGEDNDRKKRRENNESAD